MIQVVFYCIIFLDSKELIFPPRADNVCHSADAPSGIGIDWYYVVNDGCEFRYREQELWCTPTGISGENNE